jgi:hypothetical protein
MIRRGPVFISSETVIPGESLASAPTSIARRANELLIGNVISDPLPNAPRRRALRAHRGDGFRQVQCVAHVDGVGEISLQCYQFYRNA